MRKSSYVITFFVTVIVLVLVSPLFRNYAYVVVTDLVHRMYCQQNALIGWPTCRIVLFPLSDTLNWRLIIDEPQVLPGTTITVHYGLMERCQLKVVQDGRFKFVDRSCRPFPMEVQDGCRKEHQQFCISWTSARYATEMGIWFSAVALVALLFGISTHSRRRRIWRAVAGLIALHGTLA